jgi:two-component system sensor histidine kinase UhpB
MKLIFIITGSLILFSGKTGAQTGTWFTDSSVVFKMIEKADDFFEKGQHDSALIMADRANELAKTKNFYRGQGWALSKTVEVLIEQKQLTKAEQMALQAHKISNTINDTLLNGVALMQLGQVKMYDNQPDKAILLLDKSIAAGLGKFPNIYLALAFNDLGYAWGMKDEYENQADFTHKSLAIYEKLGNDAGMAMALGNLSTVYYNMGQKEKAIDYGKQSLKYREKTGDIARLSITCCNLSQYYLGINTEEAANYQELCVKYSRQTGDENRIIHSYITSSLVANARKNNKEAFEYELKVIELLEKSKKDQRMLARRYIAAAIYNDMLKYDSLVTIDYYNKSIRLSQELNDKGNLKDAYLYFSNFQNRKKNFSEALVNYKKHIVYRDSLINTEKEEKIAALERRYETNRKDIEIEWLNTEQKIKQLEIEKQKAIIAGNNAVALQRQNEIDLLSKSQELQDAKIRQQEEELVKKELLATANQQQLELSQKEKQLQERKIKNQHTLRNLLLAGLGLLLLLGYTYFNRYQIKKKLEQQTNLLAMRNSISRDLHDDIGASLSNINILNELARRNINQPEKSGEYLSKASEDIQRISESLSDIVWNINPKHDDLHNLFVRMKRYAADMLDGKNIKGHFDFPADESGVQLSMTQRRDLYLIFKEAINNLVKYSGAREATVQLKTGRHKIILQVTDNGKGFDKELIRTGNGLQNMEQRAKASGGILNVRSAPGKGTIVEMEIEVA